ncbi:hypothetical protein PFBG_05948 [Plasmodium falciparum 7G8]|uniref:Uncharacterized protein n=1 Tax=Plasmodium falciparum (isolate 7G8) TaxID=57266 RepID=W7EZV5_PLAF8|nr:hypothetical protein PFBG_05948 [Plasmodium falciparum 7G8]
MCRIIVVIGHINIITIVEIITNFLRYSMIENSLYCIYYFMLHNYAIVIYKYIINRIFKLTVYYPIIKYNF